MEGYRHYIRTDANNIIIKRFSSAFEQPLETDICVNENGGRHYNDSVTNERGQYIAKWENGEEVARTQAELDTEWNTRPIPPDPDEELATAIQAATTLDGLKAALLGNGKLAQVKGKMK